MLPVSAGEKEEGDKESLIEEPARPRSRDLATFASTSTLHGLGHICRSGRLGVRQTLWAFAFLASLAFFLYQAAKSALLYLEHPHVMALDEEAIREMVFPAITICNINRYRHSALTDADIFHLANMTGLPPKDRDGHKATDLLYPDPDMADIVNRTGHQLDDMLKSCNFSGENCSSRDFTVVSAHLAQLPWGPLPARGAPTRPRAGLCPRWVSSRVQRSPGWVCSCQGESYGTESCSSLLFFPRVTVP
uniref:Acid-sensing ion channel 4-like n=1 Tax=Cyanistes caeruleus TaxID=156563 RepID=A0A8C0V9M6_CYACU